MTSSVDVLADHQTGVGAGLALLIGLLVEKGILSAGDAAAKYAMLAQDQAAAGNTVGAGFTQAIVQTIEAIETERNRAA